MVEGLNILLLSCAMDAVLIKQAKKKLLKNLFVQVSDTSKANKRFNVCFVKLRFWKELILKCWDYRAVVFFNPAF